MSSFHMQFFGNFARICKYERCNFTTQWNIVSTLYHFWKLSVYIRCFTTQFHSSYELSKRLQIILFIISKPAAFYLKRLQVAFRNIIKCSIVKHFQNERKSLRSKTYLMRICLSIHFWSRPHFSIVHTVVLLWLLDRC